MANHVERFLEDINNFRRKKQIPAKLYQHVWSDRDTLEKWYCALSKAVGKRKLKSIDELSMLFMETLPMLHATHFLDLQAFFKFYDIAYPPSLCVDVNVPVEHVVAEPMLYQLKSLPVPRHDIQDGDGFDAHFEVKDSAFLPMDIQEKLFSGPQLKKILKPEELCNFNSSEKEYRIIKNEENVDIVARKFRIRLKGIDAPELAQGYGTDSREALRKLIGGQVVTVCGYYLDQWNRLVADVYCNDEFVQEQMLDIGAAWHHIYFDNRKSFAEEKAKDKKKGLWVDDHAEAPWDFKARQKEYASKVPN